MASAGTGGSLAVVRGLCKRYGSYPALDEVALDLSPGQLRGLLGPNGAGKTTLLRALFGLIRPDAGTIELLGRPLTPGRPTALTGVAGFVEDPTFYPYLSARANLELLCDLDSGSRDLIDDALDRVQLSSRAGDRVGGYSTGMRQRLGLAAALLRRSRLLLLDEPTSGLDPAGARAVAALLRELTADGVGVLVSSHLIGELEPLCDCYTVIRAGRVVWTGSAADVARDAPGSAYVLHTSDDEQAPAIARAVPGLGIERVAAGLRVTVADGALDAFTTALGRAGIGIRHLELVTSPLASLFFALTDAQA